MLKSDKATRYDNIRAGMIQNIGENEFEMLTERYNKIWKERIPRDWKVGIVIPLFKKGDNSNCSNYRGITLLNVVLKVYDRIVEKGMREILDKQLEESQNDFRKGRSCQDHMFTLKQISKKYVYMTRKFTWIS